MREERITRIARRLLPLLVIAAVWLLIKDYRRSREEVRRAQEIFVSTIYLPFDSTYLDGNGHLKLEVRAIRQEDRQ